MRMNELFEGIVLLGIGIAGVVEGFRLTIYKDSNILYDPIGPGSYVWLIGAAIIATAIWHIIQHRNRKQDKKDTQNNLKRKFTITPQNVRFFGSIGALVLYLSIIPVLGYLLSTMLFTTIELKLLGIKSWINNMILTIVISTAYFLIFTKYASMVFPRGIFNNWLGI